MMIGRKGSFRLAVVLVLLVATTGLLTACGGAAAGALVGAVTGAAIGSAIDDCYGYDCGCYDCDPYYYYKAGPADYDTAW